MTRPVLLGMNNPHGTWGALEPLPPGSAGHRLWRMLYDVSGMSSKEYLRAYDRRNLLPTPDWDDGEARLRGPEVRGALSGLRVAVLGAEVWRALGLPPDAAPLSIVPSGNRMGYWLRLPHPSGRCLWYNSAVNRSLAGEALFGILSLVTASREKVR